MLVCILSWLLAVIKPPEPVSWDALKPVLDLVFKITKTRGIVGLITWCKNTRLALLHYLSGEWKTKRVLGVPVDKDGYPKSLGLKLKENINNTTLLKLVLTILYSTRALNAGKSPSTSSIESPTSVSEPCNLSMYMVDFWRELGYRPSKTKVPSGIYFKKYHFTSKAGPNGQALWCSMVDLKALVSNLSLLESICVIGGPKLRTSIEGLVNSLNLLPDTLFPSNRATLRRISWFPDKENKVRVVAILDYFSQTALRALHDYLFRVLRKIPQDYTFNQGGALARAKEWDFYYSIDLTAATDRFPISLEADLLKALLPEVYVNSWVHIMVGIPFEFQGRNVNYAVGNPMGAYSSWNSFALAHHYVMYWCCRELRMDWATSKYCILGDDVLIGDHRLAHKYKEVILLLGVEFSDIKTHESSKLFEFAKRLVYNGSEITPFPVSSLVETGKKSYLLTNLLMEETKKGWSWIAGIPLTIRSFYSDVLKFNSTRAAKNEEIGFLSELMMKIMSGILPANDGLNTIIRQFDLELPVLNTDQGIAILSGTAVEVFAEGNPFDYKVGKPLGQLALDLACEVTSKYEDLVKVVAFPSDILTYIPLLAIYGQVEEKYIELSKQAYLIDTIGKGEWPNHLRSLALPISDEVFKERVSHTLARVSSVLGQRVLKNLKNLRSSDF